MAGSLVRRVRKLSDAGYGVNLFEVSAPRPVTGVSTNVVGLVALLPWGPTDTVTLVTNPAELWDAFYPDAFGAAKDYAAWPAILALQNQVLPAGGLRVVRVGATGAAKASSGAITAGTGSVTIEAAYPGLIGDQLRYQWAAASDGDAAKRDLLITVGTSYAARYKNLGLADLSAVDDPYVRLVLGAPSALPSAGSATALSGGDDGTVVAADIVGSGSSTKGVRLFYAEAAAVSVLFVAEAPTAVIDAVNAGLKAYADGAERGLAVLCTPHAQAADDAMAYVEDYRSERLVYTWPRVKTANFLDPDVGEVTVDGNAWAAFAIANVEPWLSPGGAGGAPFLRGITALEDERASTTTLDLLNDAGVAPWFMSSAFEGAILRLGCTTSLSGRTRIFDRRMTDFLTGSIARAAERFVESQLDVDLAARDLGPNADALVTAIVGFLSDEKQAKHIADFQLDPFGANTEAALAAGQWTLVLRVRLYAMAEAIVIKAQVGTTVVIAAEA
jgi:hypothetical protein